MVDLDEHTDADTVRWIGRLTQVGWLSKGLVFVVIGTIAIRLATHSWRGSGAAAGTSESTSANQDGALAVISQQPLGAALLTIVSIGLLVFMMWNIAQAFVPGSTDIDPLGLVKRAGWLGLGIFYGLLGVTGLRMAIGSSSSSSSSGSSGSGATDPQTLTARLLDAPGGRWMVVIVAVAVAAVGVYHARKGWTRDFLDDVETDDLTASQRTWLGRLGVAGFSARAFVLLVVAVFLIEAAIDFDPQDAVGLDGALRELAEASGGRLLLAVTALGFVLAGVYDMLTFRRQRLT